MFGDPTPLHAKLNRTGRLLLSIRLPYTRRRLSSLWVILHAAYPLRAVLLLELVEMACA